MDTDKQERILELRGARIEDSSAICRVLADADLPTQDLSDESFKHFVVCLVNGAIIGVVGLEKYGSSALVRSLAVAEQHRSQGFAAKLMLRIEMHAQELGVTRLFALTTTAQHYLERKGFIAIERSEVPEAVQASAQFRELCPDSALCLVKSFNRSP